MADQGGPDLELALSELNRDRLQMQLNIATADVRARQLQRELNKINANTEASKAAIAELDAKIAGVEAQLLAD